VISIGALFVASPALQKILVYPQTEFFTEFWLLGPQHKAENYPYNITRNTEYNISLGIDNHLGKSAYYQVQVKLRNQNESGPNSFNRTSSSQPILYSLNVFVANKEVWESPVVFSFDFSNIADVVNFNNLRFNGNALNVHGYSTSWDTEGKGFFEYLLFELWIYNETSNSFEYHERATSLRLNMQP
jgi:uncharacterized membrane protein